jgi:cellulose synthase/poly-beta-1,6-N-acetylglucosamine synthase-like glycosyltransferase
MKLDYPKDRHEVILVNNRSIDSSESIARKYPIKVLREEKVQSSYAARNKGITVAKGELIVFSDADCVVAPDWLSNYIKYVAENHSDIVAGHVEITTGSEANLYETYDRCKFDQSFFFREFNFGATANLLVRRNVFKKIGAFDGRLMSSGDLEFCQRAFNSRFKIDYCKSALVLHPARSTLRALLKKEFRIGYGYAQIYFKHKLGNLFLHRWRLFVPNRDFLRSRSGELNFGQFRKAMFVLIDWICNWAWIFGNMQGILRLNKS